MTISALTYNTCIDISYERGDTIPNQAMAPEVIVSHSRYIAVLHVLQLNDPNPNVQFFSDVDM